MNKIIEYFDLVSQYRPGGSRAVHAGGAPPSWIPQYIALVLGIIVQPYLQKYMSTGAWDITGLWGWIVASLIIAVMAFPAVYKQSFDATQPMFIQFCVIFTTGTGWQTLVSSAFKAGGVGGA